jgi:hypothetical protein
MTSGDLYRNALRLVTWFLFLVVAGCGPNRVLVEGNFPEPLVDPIPVSLGVWFPDEFRNHEFHDEAKKPGSSDWVVNTGAAQVKMWEALLKGMFAEVVLLEIDPTLEIVEGGVVAAKQKPDFNLDAIFIPTVEELQYAIPAHTNIKVYEIWMRYRLSLTRADGESIHEWSMTSYGKTPTAFLQSDEDAVNFAAVMALRDAGANFTSSFSKIPEIREWLENLAVSSSRTNDIETQSIEGDAP